MGDSSINPRFINQIQQPTSLVELTYEAIRDAIITGRIKPSQRMMQVDMAKELGVSERTVREAFGRLVTKGLAVHEPYKGVRVAALPIQEMEEIYLMRAMLEGHAMELAAECISPAELQRMKEILPLTTAGEGAASVHHAQEMNREFHWIPINAAGSRVLSRVLDELWELMFAYDLLYEDTPEARLKKSKADLAQHAELIQALEARDGKLASRINTDHIHTTINGLLAWLGKNPLPEMEKTTANENS